MPSRFELVRGISSAVTRTVTRSATDLGCVQFHALVRPRALASGRRGQPTHLHAELPKGVELSRRKVDSDIADGEGCPRAANKRSKRRQRRLVRVYAAAHEAPRFKTKFRNGRLGLLLVVADKGQRIVSRTLGVNGAENEEHPRWSVLRQGTSVDMEERDPRMLNPEEALARGLTGMRIGCGVRRPRARQTLSYTLGLAGYASRSAPRGPHGHDGLTAAHEPQRTRLPPWPRRGFSVACAMPART